MLEFKRITPNIIEVKESILGWYDTKISYIYYDIVNWMKSEVIKEPTATPELKRKVDKSDREWVERYYLPKLFTS